MNPPAIAIRPWLVEVDSWADEYDQRRAFRELDALDESLQLMAKDWRPSHRPPKEKVTVAQAHLLREADLRLAAGLRDDGVNCRKRDVMALVPYWLSPTAAATAMRRAVGEVGVAVQGDKTDLRWEWGLL
jgi:hypothetical protein